MLSIVIANCDLVGRWIIDYLRKRLVSLEDPR